MKKFAYRTLLFLLPLIVIAYPLDVFFSKTLKKSHKYSGEIEVWNDIYSGKITADIAVYGSSRAWVHVDSQVLEDSMKTSVYNFGMNGHNFWLQYLRHKEYLACNKQPRLILQSVDAFTLEKRENLYQAEQFLPYMLWNNDIYTFTRSYIGFNLFEYFIPLIRYSGRTAEILDILRNGETAENCRKKGFTAVDRTWGDDLKKAQIQKKSYAITFDPESILLFEAFIRECREKQIELILVYTPEYIEGQKFISNRGRLINLYKEYGKKYHLTFLDYSGDEICLDKNLFYNASHLNRRGAEIFSRKLAGDIKNKRTTAYSGK